MDLQSKTIPILYDGDSYEVIINGLGEIQEIWRYRGNQTIRPEFCRLEWLDKTLQHQIYDRVVRYL